MVRVEEVSKVYRGRGGAVEALSGVSLEFSEGSFTALVGRSGCGKTTLLRLIAGLERESGGRIVRSVPRRQVGYVFQEPRLMPWLSVAENVRFAARSGGPAGGTSGTRTRSCAPWGWRISPDVCPTSSPGAWPKGSRWGGRSSAGPG